MGLNDTLFEAKYAKSSVPSAYFSFNKCPTTHDVENAKFRLIETKRITV